MRVYTFDSYFGKQIGKRTGNSKKGILIYFLTQDPLILSYKIPNFAYCHAKYGAEH